MNIPDPFILESIDSARKAQLTGMSDSKNTTTDADACPVDHKSREAWLQQARPQAQPPAPPSPAQPSTSWRQTIASYLPFPSARTAPAPESPQQKKNENDGLGTSRVVSSIPRSSTPGASACPVNHEQETGKDKGTGNWVYPSEKMFFDAMRRKGHAAREGDMRTVVPIHNAVNERAWAEIKAWEGPYLEGSQCDGPRLHSFAGKNDKMSPRARMNTLLGYTAPFDRHDWVVDRCGTRIEYIIDFYAGRGGGAGPSFYLDVRPKLNTWEGVKMRFMRGAGLV